MSDLVERLTARSLAGIRQEERPTVSRARADARWWMAAIAEELARFGHYERAAQWLVDHAELNGDGATNGSTRKLVDGDA
ncbi:MAG: hypothetical protein ABL993_02470 [Vicinamibacterales bacterium]